MYAAMYELGLLNGCICVTVRPSPLTPHLSHMFRFLSALMLCTLFVSFNGCQQQQQQQQNAVTPTYKYVEGYTAYMRGNKAVAPTYAPPRIKRIIAAANKIIGRPYRRGGGHGRHHDSAYDCSGSVGFVLREVGAMGKQNFRSSGEFLRWGRPGYGKWLTVFVKRGHVFMMVAGLRFDTSGRGSGVGPRWYTTPRRCSGFYVRHIPGL